MIDWETIVEQYGPLVWATVFRLVDNHADASDCFQETFLEAVKVARRESVRDWPSLLRPLSTARGLGLLRGRCRSRGRMEAQADLDGFPGQGSSPESKAEGSELAERLRTALAELPAQQAEVFCLCCVDQMSYREIGQRMQLTTNAVGVQLHRARRKLKELLEPVAAKATGKDRGL
jgi:RNA polymerase sigma-70 factor, ECF subfamily